MFLRYLHNKFIPLLSPEDLSIGSPDGVDDEPADDSAVLDEGNDEDPDETGNQDDEPGDDGQNSDGENEDEDKDKAKDEVKDDEENNEENEDEDDENLEIPVAVKDIKAKYPDFFKTFPEVRGAIFRDQQYGALFANPKEAEEVVSKAETFDAIEADLLGKGDASEILTSVHKSNPKSFAKLAVGLMPVIQSLDKDTYANVAAIPIKQLLRSAHNEGKGSDGKLTDLGKAALWIHNYFFGKDSRLEDPVTGEIKQTEEKSESEKRAEQKLAEIDRREFTAFKSDIDNTYVNRITKEIRTVLDKDDRLSEFVKRTIVKEGLAEIKSQLEADQRYQKTMSSLSAQARRAGYTSEFKSRILSVALARAKSLAPSIRAKLVAEALGNSKQKEKDKGGEKKELNLKPRTERREREEKPSREQRPKPKTDLDILNS